VNQQDGVVVDFGFDFEFDFLLFAFVLYFISHFCKMKFVKWNFFFEIG
jgi:hypothetical protein